MSSLLYLTIPLTTVISWVLAVQSEKDAITSWMNKLEKRLVEEGYAKENINQTFSGIIYEGAGQQETLSLDFIHDNHEFIISRSTSSDPSEKIVKFVALLNIDKKQKERMIKYRIIDQLLNSNPFMRVPKLSKEIFSSLQPEMKKDQLTSTYLQFLNEDQIDDIQKVVLYPNAKIREITKLVDELTQLADTINQLNFIDDNPEEANNQDEQNYGLQCIICKQSVLIDQIGKYDIIMQLMCCNYFVHKNHLGDWLTQNNTCPSCRRKSPRWMRVNLN